MTSEQTTEAVVRAHADDLQPFLRHSLRSFLFGRAAATQQGMQAGEDYAIALHTSLHFHESPVFRRRRAPDAGGWGD